MTLDEPKFLTPAEVLHLSEESPARYGGSPGVREPGLVGFAPASARNAFWSARGGRFEIAAADAFHRAESQAPADGNKRTAAAAVISFMRKNGRRSPKEDGSVYRAMIALAEKRLDKTGLAAVLKQLAEK